jgi:hypothetical protein
MVSLSQCGFGANSGAPGCVFRDLDFANLLFVYAHLLFRISKGGCMINFTNTGGTNDGKLLLQFRYLD